MPTRALTRRLLHPYLHPSHSRKRLENDIGLWPFLLSLVDDSIPETGAPQVPKRGRQRQQSRAQPAPTVCKIIKHPIDPVYTVVELSEGVFSVSIPVGEGFKPENLDVKVKDREVIVQMKIDQASEDGMSELSQVFTKKVALPEEVKVEEVKSRLTPEGVLKIEAPLPVPQEPPKPEAVDIPVTMEVEDRRAPKEKGDS